MKLFFRVNIFWLSLASTGALAAPIVDQENLPGSIVIVASSAFQQEVVAGLSGQLVQIDLFTTWETSDVSFGLNVGSPWQTDADDLLVTGLSTAAGLLTVDLSSAGIFLDAGESFVFWASSDQTDLRGTGDNAYPGDLYAGGSPYQNRNIDLSFRTYMEAVPVPEPGVPGLLGMGLVALGWMRHRQSRGVTLRCTE